MKSIETILDTFAELLLYPAEGQGERIQACLDQLTDGQPEVVELVAQHWKRCGPLALAQREELYIKTFDLNKTGTLDLGWHLFGEDYNRGLFLVKLRKYLQLLKIPETGELPDHVSQVLRILGRMSPEEANQFAFACVIPSLETIAASIQDDNPYDPLVQGLIQLLRNLFEVPPGFEETIESEYAPPFSQLPVIQ